MGRIKNNLVSSFSPWYWLLPRGAGRRPGRLWRDIANAGACGHHAHPAHGHSGPRTEFTLENDNAISSKQHQRDCR